MTWALGASLFVNGLLVGLIVGGLFVSRANQEQEKSVVDVVPGGGIQQGQDDTYEAGRMGFKA
jgi:hypothetical protein